MGKSKKSKRHFMDESSKRKAPKGSKRKVKWNWREELTTKE